MRWSGGSADFRKEAVVRFDQRFFFRLRFRGVFFLADFLVAAFLEAAFFLGWVSTWAWVLALLFLGVDKLKRWLVPGARAAIVEQRLQ